MSGRPCSLFLCDDTIVLLSRGNYHGIAEFFANKNPQWISGEKGWRIDWVAIEAPPVGLTFTLKDVMVRHYINS